MKKTLYVLGFLFDKEVSNVVLIEKNRPDWQKGKLNGIGGRVEELETSYDAMIREFREETGLDITDWKHFTTIGEEHYEISCYVSFSDSINKVVTMTDEIVFVHSIEKIWTENFPMVPNLLKLISLAMSETK